MSLRPFPTLHLLLLLSLVSVLKTQTPPTHQSEDGQKHITIEEKLTPIITVVAHVC